MPYKLRQSVVGHTSDIRKLCLLTDTKIVTSSRDATSIVWDCQNQKEFLPCYTLIGHKKYINSCCILPTSAENPEGLILTGGHDNVIIAYRPGIVTPFRIFCGHENIVSALTSLNDDKFASGSWDSTIKIWNINYDNCTNTLKHHSGSVFALLLHSTANILLSASADKKINVYEWPKLELIQSLTGHFDCVRDLAELNGNAFLSCSNDGTIRHWNAETGMVLETLFVHDNFLYSISAISDGSLIVSCGENNSLIIIDNKSQDSAVLTLPAVTIWTNCILPNRDIVTGSSDGILRVFSADPVRQALISEIEKYEEEVRVSLNILNNPQSNWNDKTKVDILGPDALRTPGTAEGQILLVNENDETVCYQWSQSLSKWLLIGDVTAIKENKTASQFDGVQQKKKILFEGKTYDYVFNIDVKEGCPPLQLPFNDENNVYEVTDEFLLKNNLPQQYRSEIVNFILKNTSTAATSVSGASVFPIENFLIFKNIDIEKARSKLLEFTKILKKETGILNEEVWVDKIVEMAKSGLKPNEEILVDLEKFLLVSSQELVFPALDLIRVSMTQDEPNSVLCSENSNFDLHTIMDSHTSENSTVVNNKLIIKLMANMVLHKSGQDFTDNHKYLFLSICKNLSSKRDKTTSLEIAISTLLINLIILQIKSCKIGALKDCFDMSLTILQNMNSKESILKILAGIGTAVTSLKNVHIHETKLRYLELLSRQQDKDDMVQQISKTAAEILKCIYTKT